MTRVRVIILGLLAILMIGLAAPALAATPGSRTVTIQLTFDDATGNESFVASGPGICAGGIADQRNIEFIQFDDSFSIRMTKRLVCDDGSGSIDIYLSAGEQAGSPTRSGGWAITGGSGDYADAVGGGTLTAKGRYPGDPVGVDTMTGAVTR
jgi:hypothetical protein